MVKRTYKDIKMAYRGYINNGIFLFFGVYNTIYGLRKELLLVSPINITLKQANNMCNDLKIDKGVIWQM
jgi:hypothetical protein